MSYLLFVCSGQPRNVPKRVMHVQSCCFGQVRFNLMIFFSTQSAESSRCRCCREFCKSNLETVWQGFTDTISQNSGH